MLPVTALSSFVYCPRQFYASYVLKEKVVLNQAMVLGSIKHRAFDMFSSKEESLVSSIDSSDDVFSVFENSFRRCLRKSVVVNKASLRFVEVSLDSAFKISVPTVLQEANSRAKIISSFMAQNIVGEELWNALIPKHKSEMSLKSETLGLKGRVDRIECYPDALVPVELKSGKTPENGVWEHHRIQACAYALLFEDRFNNSVHKSVVHYVDSGIKRDVVINPFLRDWVKDIAKKAHSIIESKEVPKGCERPSCNHCSRDL